MNASSSSATAMEIQTIFYLLFVCGPLLSAALDSSELRTYIVHLQHPDSTVFASSDDLYSWYHSYLPTATASHDTPRMVHRYTNVVTGFAARLTELELSDMSAKAGFLHAYPDSLRPLLTTHTPNFLGLQLQKGLWGQSNLGEGIIIGLLDSGIFPNHPSFRGDGMPPPPAKWKGKCEFNASLCNNKLIGARNLVSRLAAIKGEAVASTEAPLDEEGHGTHTSSTAAGAFGRNAQVLGNAEGTASGIAPRSHLAMYKVCATDGCADSDLLAGMDAAVADGVDVLSISIGGPSGPFFENSIAIGAFRAIQKGVFVSCSAGNSGPFASTLSNEAPWILTVGASTLDRSIRATVKLGNELQLDGESLFQPKAFSSAMYPLVYAGAGAKPDAALCGNDTLDSRDIIGKIVLCEQGRGIARIDKGVNVKKAGGIGMILMNTVDDGFSTLADAHVLPASHVSYLDGTKIKAYINSSSNPTATIIFKGTLLGSQAPVIASFSSRGPSLASPGILKPDITGPGVNILAAWPFDLETTNSTAPTFNIISGTSMSAPHLSGTAALIKSAHPSWSPAAVKSAIMTTADLSDNNGKAIMDQNLQGGANLFAVGAGHVKPERANDPGLIYDISADDYIPYLCGLSYDSNQVSAIVGRSIDCAKVKKISEAELNYPSFSVAFGGAANSVSVSRTVRNVGEANSTYSVKVDAPDGVSVMVEPKRILFSEVNQEQKFQVIFSDIGHGGLEVSQGYLQWISKKRIVRSPISVSFKN